MFFQEYAADRLNIDLESVDVLLIGDFRQFGHILRSAECRW